MPASPNHSRKLLLPLASATTLTAVAMAAVAAVDRGGTALDRGLLVALSVAIVAGVHLIPALSTTRLKWLLWAGCLLATSFGHIVFFVHAGMRAGEAQAHQSAAVTGTGRQVEAVSEALAAITARPVAVIASRLANTQGRRERAALRLELAEAQRAAALRDELVRLAATQTQAEVAGATDPVIARLAAVTGSSEASISLAVGLLFSLLVELLGALLWIEALRGPTPTHNPPPEPAPAPAPADPLADLRAAIEAGTVKPTVAGIRAFLGCGQAKAMELRRTLAA